MAVIGILGPCGGLDLGDEAIPVHALRDLRQSVPDAEIATARSHCEAMTLPTRTDAAVLAAQRAVDRFARWVRRAPGIEECQRHASEKDRLEWSEPGDGAVAPHGRCWRQVVARATRWR